jgi:hypothetical protein
LARECHPDGFSGQHCGPGAVIGFRPDICGVMRANPFQKNMLTLMNTDFFIILFVSRSLCIRSPAITDKLLSGLFSLGRHLSPLYLNEVAMILLLP